MGGVEAAVRTALQPKDVKANMVPARQMVRNPETLLLMEPVVARMGLCAKAVNTVGNSSDIHSTKRLTSTLQATVAPPMAGAAHHPPIVEWDVTLHSGPARILRYLLPVDCMLHLPSSLHPAHHQPLDPHPRPV